MKIFTIISVILITFSTITTSTFIGKEPNRKQDGTAQPKVYFDEYFYTRVDHFTPQDTRRAVFNYKLNVFYYATGGPLFIYLNNGIPGGEHWIENGLMFDVALPLSGALITFDQRYTGNNIPTETASFDDLKYLTIEQSLADIATLIYHLKNHLMIATKPKVIVWGNGYGGILAAWSRIKYPHLIDAAWSTSGYYQTEPLSATFAEYTGFNFLMYGGGDCYYGLRDIFDVIEDLIDTNQSEELQETFNLCSPLDTTSAWDVARFIETQIDFIGGYVNSNDIFGIHDLCSQINTNDPFSAYVRWWAYTYGDHQDCIDVDYENHIELLSDINWNQNGTITGYRQWMYRQCTQLGLLQISSQFTIFPDRIPESFQIETCANLFGDKYDFNRLQAAIDHVDITYGQYYLHSEKIVFSNGVIDPLHYKGLQFLRNPYLDSYVLNTNYVSRYKDMDSINRWDIGPLTITKQRISEIITNWATE